MELQNVVVRVEAEIMALEDRIITAMKQRDRARAEALSKQRARLRLELAVRREVHA